MAALLNVTFPEFDPSFYDMFLRLSHHVYGRGFFLDSALIFNKQTSAKMRRAENRTRCPGCVYRRHVAKGGRKVWAEFGSR